MRAAFIALALLAGADSEDALRRAVEREPESARANYELGVALFRKGEIAEARPLLEKAVKLAPRHAGAAKALGAAYAAGEQYELAEPLLGRACALDRKEPDACYYHGRALYALNRFVPALAALDKALPHDRQPWRVHLALAQAHEALGNAAEAEPRFRLALREQRGQAAPDFDPRLHYGIFLLRQGRGEEALEMLGANARAHPRSSRAHAELGRALLQARRTEEAATALGRAVELEPRNWAAHLLLGKAYYRLGRADLGERHTRLGDQGSETSR